MTVESCPGRVTVDPLPLTVVVRVCVITLVMVPAGLDTVDVRPGILTVFPPPTIVDVLVCVTRLVIVRANPVTVL